MDRRVMAFYSRAHVVDQGKRLLAAAVAERCEVPVSAVLVQVVASKQNEVEADCIIDMAQLPGTHKAVPASDLRALCDVVAAKTEQCLRGLGARWSAHGR